MQIQEYNYRKYYINNIIFIYSSLNFHTGVRKYIFQRVTDDKIEVEVPK